MRNWRNVKKEFLIFPIFPTSFILSWEIEETVRKKFLLFPTFPTSYILSWEMKETVRNNLLHFPYFLRVIYFREKLKKRKERISYISYISYELYIFVRNWRNKRKISNISHISYELYLNLIMDRINDARHHNKHLKQTIFKDNLLSSFALTHHPSPLWGRELGVKGFKFSNHYERIR